MRAGQEPEVVLIIAADEPALFFSSVTAAENYLEAVDVRDGVYTGAYGAGGEPYSLRAEGNRVAIEPDAGTPRVAELTALLRSYLSRVGPPSEHLNLAGMLAAVRSHVSA